MLVDVDGLLAGIEGTLERVEELPDGRLKTSLKAHDEQVRLGKRMVTIVRDVPIELELDRARWTRYDYDKARRVFDHLEFRRRRERDGDRRRKADRRFRIRRRLRL